MAQMSVHATTTGQTHDRAPQPRDAMATILPPDAIAIESWGDDPDAHLLPEEAALIGGAVEGRRREFATGRSLARRALARLGCADVPILPGPNREPQWPPGVVGSITHCAGYRAAVVAAAASLATIGIDAEIHAALPHGIAERVCREEERLWIHTRADAGVWWDRLFFSAKESVFKAWFPVTGAWLGFHDVTMTVDADARTFVARLAIPPPTVNGREISAFDGRYLVRDGFVFTSATLC